MAPARLRGKILKGSGNMRLALALLTALMLCSPVLAETVDLTYAPAESTGLTYVGTSVLSADTPNQGTVEIKTDVEYTVSVGKADAKGVPITITIDKASATAMGQDLPSSYAGKECKGLWDNHAFVTEVLTPFPAQSAPADQFVESLVSSHEFMLPGEAIEVGGKWKGARENGPSLFEEADQTESKEEWEGTLVSLKDGVAAIELDVQVQGGGGGVTVDIKGKLKLELDTKTWTLLRSVGTMDGVVHTPGGEVKFKIPEMKIELKTEPRKEG